MKLYTVNTGMFKLDGGAMFGVVPKSIWQNINPADEHNLCNWAMRSMLIEEGDKLILIDTGIGDKQSEKFFSHYHLNGNDSLHKSLDKLGFHADDITDVILTHLHFDHCGGSVIRKGDRLIPAFKNAVYWSNEQHWQWATQPNDREKASFLSENILPIEESGQLKFIPQSTYKTLNTLNTAGNAETMNALETVESGIIPQLSMKIVDGHTAAMMLPQIKYQDRTIMYMADLLPSSGHIPLPYVMAYDMFPLTTLIEKRLFLEEALQNDYILFFEHDPINECCNLQQTPKGIRPGDCFSLAAI